jgi:hypothetical protein
MTTKKFFPTVYHRIKKHFVTDFHMTQVLTNHGKLNNYLMRFKERDDVYEVCTAAIDDSEHIIYDCIKFDVMRAQLISELERIDCRWPCPLPQLLLQGVKLRTET